MAHETISRDVLTAGKADTSYIIINMLGNSRQIFQYNGSPITFRLGDSVMVNATEMAKPFGKRPVDYLRLPSTLELIAAIVRKSHISENQLVTTLQGSSLNGGGTWMHEDVALDFAQWLSVDFKLWCNDRIKELLTQGVATVNDDDATILHAMQVLQKRVEEKQRVLQAAQETMAIQSEQLKGQQPKVDYYDKVLNSTSTMTTGQVAACFGMSAIALNKKLCAIDMQYKQSGMYFLKHPYSSYHLSDVRTYPYNKADGTVGTKQYLVWNERGKQFLVMLHQNGFDIKRTKQEISPDFWMMLLRPQCATNKNK